MEATREKNRIILEFDSAEDAEKVQRAIDAHRYFEIVRKSKATDADVEELADEINRTWWKENKPRYIELTKGMKDVADEEIEMLSDDVNLAGYNKRYSL